MKKQTINYSWPAKLLDFSTNEAQGNFSRGKLSVFYKGETADHRYFTDEFSEELIKTLPYTPIVSYYDEEKDDFVGHATEQQIYGIVDPCFEPTFEEGEDGNIWCVCDTVYYTERPDKVGELAKKIEGHAQSLELDPRSVKYKINYDDKKHFKNIEFTAGKFVGVSVLGKDQKPAFTGSEFFASNEDFEKKMQLLRDYCEGKKDQTQSGGEKMNLEEFITLSWGEKSAKVSQKVASEYQHDAYTYLIDAYDDCVIMGFYYYYENSLKTMRIYYSIDENNEVSLNNIEEVHVTYETVMKPENTTNAEETDIEHQVSNTEDAGLTNAEGQTTGKESEDEANEDNKNADSSEEKPEDDKKEDCGCGKDDEDDDKKNGNCEKDFSNPAQAENVESTPVNEKVSVENEQKSTSEETSSSTSFTESERAEFEALKREEKITLVNSYKDDLTDEQYNNFITNIDSFEKQNLELELLKAYKANASSYKPMRAFAFAPVNNAKTQDSLDDFVRSYSRK